MALTKSSLLWYYRKYTHILRGVAMFVLTQLAMLNGDAVMEWNTKRWAFAIGAALIAAMRAGEFNDPPPDTKP